MQHTQHLDSVHITVKRAVYSTTGHEDAEGVELYSFCNLDTRWRWVINATPRPHYPEKEIRYPMYRRPGRPQGRLGRVRKISPPSQRDSIPGPSSPSLYLPTHVKLETEIAVTLFSVTRTYFCYLFYMSEQMRITLKPLHCQKKRERYT